LKLALARAFTLAITSSGVILVSFTLEAFDKTLEFFEPIGRAVHADLRRPRAAL
jgi:hypothetical protein